jgi:hypothetical protein
MTKNINVTVTAAIATVIREYNISIKIKSRNDIIKETGKISICACTTLEKGKCPIIYLVKEDLSKINNDELQFIIGHELGHIITDSADEELADRYGEACSKGRNVNKKVIFQKIKKIEEGLLKANPNLRKSNRYGHRENA